MISPKNKINNHSCAPCEELTKTSEIRLVVPRTILDELARNRGRLVEESGRSLSAALKRAKEAAEKFGDPKHKRVANRELLYETTDVINDLRPANSTVFG